MRTREYIKLAAKYSPAIEAIATKLTYGCPQFRDELISEGHARLFTLKLSRAVRPDPYIRAAIANSMKDLLRKLKPDMVTCSIETAFQRGFKLSQDTGETRLQWARQGWPAICEMFL